LATTQSYTRSLHDALPIYKATGDVEVNSYEKDQKLNTEELFWRRDKGEIYTDKFVRIETAEEILLGEGLTATQDFSSYKILKPRSEEHTSELQSRENLVCR